MDEVRADFEARQERTRRYGEFAYRARSWPHARRLIVKAEVTTHFGRKPKDNPRFVVTNLKTTPRHIYEVSYCARGDDGTTVGRDVIVGANSVVTRDIDDFAIAAGAPATVVRHRTESPVQNRS